ncbi:protein of unknown function DUF399 [Thermocrinis albus DSM 14484]|uniref:Haem-binding uptake Tiki superfamily ChaN domain-containing protein n=1 Tax=Thermocrinis albus (strain DSM 14484 / JCM 11386 / HI 11/12) TaxID=638303 RepID=D3SMY6_THEAH|nr:ChaN family lipoprotein [Thermocrinis albus]ADC90116.1 protein of unknown function DUF399 [Thermocrinis albus DSM 14484]
MLSLLLTISLLIGDARVIYIPEEHTSKEDHAFQLEVIRKIWESGEKLVIAMEMFQQPFQTFLDQYISCDISEEEMLQKTQYRKRWGYDPSFYAPIWRYAKEKGIKIYAINIPTELVKKVREEGLEKVRDPALPYPPMEPTQQEKDLLLGVLKEHPKVDVHSFLDVQTAWDSGMALAIARILEKEKDSRVVVLVGGMHAPSLEEGVPRRVALLVPGVKQKILRRENYQRLFSMDLSKDRSSANSMRDPNCRP